MKIIDITGPIYEGMWDYGFPDGQFKLRELNYEYNDEPYYHEGFDGMVGSTGTFMETGATYLGYEKAISVDKIPVEKLVNVDACVLQTPYDRLEEKDERKYISLDDIKKAEKENIPENVAIIVGTGYGQRWKEKDYMAKSPFFKKEAFNYLLDKKPILIVSDFPNWDNNVHPEGFLKRLYNSGVIVLVCCVNLEKITKFKVTLTALPIKVLNTCMCPTRAVVIEK
jgi:kynurenine formamidase